MRTATPATGRPLQSSGKSVGKFRPTRLTSSPTRRPAAPKPHVTSQLQCYIPALTDNDRRSPRKINRQPRRLEFTISHTKQTPTLQINRQQSATSTITNHDSQITSQARSNRHFLQVSASHQCRIAATNRPPQAASKNVSNRQWQILEINVNLSKQTIAPRSNRHKNAFAAPRKRPVSRAGTFWGLCGSQRSANADLRSFRSGCHKALGR